MASLGQGLRLLPLLAAGSAAAPAGAEPCQVAACGRPRDASSAVVGGDELGLLQLPRQGRVLNPAAAAASSSSLLAWWEDWDKKLPELVAQFDADAKLTGLLTGALDFAARQVELHLPAIEANVQARGLRALNLLWPGNGYNEAAYGGQFEVLSLLERRKVLKVGNIMGASGGACSTILSLADSQGSASAVLMYNMIYSQQGMSAVGQLWRETSFWSAVYRRVLQDASSFDRVSQRGRVVCCCGWFRPLCRNSVFYNFTTVEQAVNAYYASGDASLGGLALGTTVVPEAGGCLDGGSPVNFPDSSASLLYYHAFYGDAASASIDEIVNLFQHGVNETIRLLESADLTTEFNGEPIMMAVMPGPSGRVTDTEFAKLTAVFGLRNRETTFYDIVADASSVGRR